MRTIIGVILIIGGIALGYTGYNKLENSKAGIKIGDFEIAATDSGQKTNAWVMIGGGAVILITGAWLMRKKAKGSGPKY